MKPTSRHRRELNRRKEAHRRIKEGAAKVERIFAKLAEDSVALEWDPATIRYIHELWDFSQDVVFEIENYADQGQIKLL